MNSPEVMDLVIGALQGLGATTVFLLVLFIGFCVVLGFPKLRQGSRKTLVIRNLADLDGTFKYLPPDAPRGPADQLKTPELLEQADRKD
ncbi:MAG: hypothetical protein VYB87_01500 [Acidobacteriota bacterium]|nr:hypothetical protein [Acidobacteriota bacterium]